MPAPSRTKISGIRQLQEGQEDTKVLRYTPDRQITHDNDLIDKAFVSPMQAMLNELLPPDADPLSILDMAGTTLYNGYLSQDSAANYETGKGAGSAVTYIINDPTFTLSTPNITTAVNKGDQGRFECWISGALVDTFDLAGRFDEAHRQDSQVGLPANSANGLITVLSIEKYGISLWQKVTVRLNIAAVNLHKGYSEIVLKHIGCEGGDQITQAYKVFYDDATTIPTITIIDVELQTVSPKWLSGVQYAGAGTTILVDGEGQALYDNTYVLNPVNLTGFHGAPDVVIAPDDASVSGLSNPPKVTEVMTVTDKLITLSVANNATKDARITATPRDPFGAYAPNQSPSHKILVNTFAHRSTDTIEHFDSENYRLPLTWNGDDKTAAITGQWDSTALLAAGNAQQGIIADNENGLLYPAENFTPYLPANTANYAGRSGDAKYLRAFLASSSKTSIVLTLEGVAGGVGALGGSDINVEIKLPTQTGWLDVAKPYDSAKGVATDGNGCLVGAISYAGGNATIQTTFGGKNTFAAGGRLLVRITLRNGTRTIKSIQTNW